MGDGPARAAKGATTGGVSYRSISAGTNSDLENLYRHVDTQISAVRSEMKGEIATVMATVREAEAQRTIDYQKISSGLAEVKSTLPTTNTIWKIVLTGFGSVIGAAALAWAIFDTGAGVTGTFADKVLEAKSAAQASERQAAAINAKIDRLLQAQEKANADAETSKPAKPSG
jgi:hypothetical protein